MNPTDPNSSSYRTVTSAYTPSLAEIKTAAYQAVREPGRLKPLSNEERFNLASIILDKPSAASISATDLEAIYNKLRFPSSNEQPKNKTLGQTIQTAFNNMVGSLFGDVKLNKHIQGRLSSANLESTIKEQKAIQNAKIAEVTNAIEEITGKLADTHKGVAFENRML